MLHLFAQTITTNLTTVETSGTSAGSLAILLIPVVVLAFILIAAQWKIFKKAGRPGWAAIVPVYNTYVLFEITGYPAWISLLQLVPVANIIAVVYAVMATFKLGKLFGKSDGFAICMILFPYITYPILGFGNATFNSSAAAVAPVAPSYDPAASMSTQSEAPVAQTTPDQTFIPAQPAPTEPATTPQATPQYPTVPQPSDMPQAPTQPNEQQPPFNPPANPIG